MMKKIMTGLTAVALLTACGQMESVEPDNGGTTASEQNVETEMSTENEDDQAADEEPAANNETAEEAQENETADESAKEANTEEEEAAAYEAEVDEFDLDLEWKNGDEWEYDYRADRDNETDIERDGDESVRGEAAAQEIEELLAAVDIHKDRSIEEMRDDILAHIDMPLEELDDIEIEMKLASGEELQVDQENIAGTEPGAVRELDIDIDFTNGEDLEYDYEADDPEAEIEHRDGTEVEGREALEEIESLLGAIQLQTNRPIRDMKDELVTELDLDESEIEKIEVEVKWESGEEMKWKHKTS
ncbi:YusW family protein [Bacillus daqingensis]|uniref:YusW family protein n=2 Tax=Bacillus daqingensis TaxID=872396 RepID=A0ABV9NTS6_9BACI